MRPDTAEPVSLSADTASVNGLFTFPFPLFPLLCVLITSPELGHKKAQMLLLLNCLTLSHCFFQLEIFWSHIWIEFAREVSVEFSNLDQLLNVCEIFQSVGCRNSGREFQLD